MRQRKYHWDEWFSKPRTVLLRNVHYDCSQSTMVQSIRNEASTRGLRVKILDCTSGTEIVFEVTGRRKPDEVPSTNKASVVG